MRALLCALMRKPVRKGSASTLLMGPAALPYGGVPCPVCGTQCCVSGLSPGVTLRDQQEPVGYRRVGFSTKTRNSRVLPATRISKGVYGSVLRKHSLALRSSPALGLGWGWGRCTCSHDQILISACTCSNFDYKQNLETNCVSVNVQASFLVLFCFVFFFF